MLLACTREEHTSYFCADVGPLFLGVGLWDSYWNGTQGVKFTSHIADWKCFRSRKKLCCRLNGVCRRGCFLPIEKSIRIKASGKTTYSLKTPITNDIVKSNALTILSQYLNISCGLGFIFDNSKHKQTFKQKWNKKVDQHITMKYKWYKYFIELYLKIPPEKCI